MELSAKKRSQLAAAFSISNMGQRVPDDIAETRFGWSETPQSAICNLAGHLMESDEHEDIFVSEAEMWGRYLDDHTKEDILRIHGPHCPWIQKIVDVPEEALA